MFRVVSVQGGFRIQERVSQNGMYIEWAGLFKTVKSALYQIETELRIKLEQSQCGTGWVEVSK